MSEGDSESTTVVSQVLDSLGLPPGKPKVSARRNSPFGVFLNRGKKADVLSTAAGRRAESVTRPRGPSRKKFARGEVARELGKFNVESDQLHQLQKEREQQAAELLELKKEEHASQQESVRLHEPSSSAALNETEKAARRKKAADKMKETRHLIDELLGSEQAYLNNLYRVVALTAPVLEAEEETANDPRELRAFLENTRILTALHQGLAQTLAPIRPRVESMNLQLSGPKDSMFQHADPEAAADTFEIFDDIAKAFVDFIEGAGPQLSRCYATHAANYYNVLQAFAQSEKDSVGVSQFLHQASKKRLEVTPLPLSRARASPKPLSL